jgi:hypothetical protein
MVWRGLGRAGLVVFALALSGCVHRISEDESRVGEKTRDCIVPVAQGVSELGAPVSLDYPDASLWIWDSVIASDGTRVPNASARVSDGSVLCASGPELTRDAGGVPQSLLALSAAERAANAARTDGRQLVLSAHGGFVSENVGYLYYEHSLVGPGVFDVQVLGTGLCIVSATDQPCERLEVEGSSVLWPPSAWPKNQGGLVVGERAFLLGCRQLASFDDPCVISSVPLDQIQNPAAYRYFNAFSDWAEAPDSASVVLNLAGAVTLTRTDDRYAATNLDIFDATFRVRFAAAPTGDYGMPVDLCQGQPPMNGFARGGRAHQALRANERSLALTYFVADDGPAHGLHLLEFELNRGLE